MAQVLSGGRSSQERSRDSSPRAPKTLLSAPFLLSMNCQTVAIAVPESAYGIRNGSR